MEKGQLTPAKLRELRRSRTEIHRVWLYCRVVSDDALALEMQVRHLRDFAGQHGWRVAGVSTDHHAGTDLFRPGIAELSRAAKDGKMDAVLVFNLSRLCRSAEDASLYLDFLSRHGIVLYSVSEGKAVLADYDAICKALAKK